MNYIPDQIGVIEKNETKILDKPPRGLRVFSESHRLTSPRVLSPALSNSQASIFYRDRKLPCNLKITDLFMNNPKYAWTACRQLY